MNNKRRKLYLLIILILIICSVAFYFIYKAKSQRDFALKQLKTYVSYLSPDMSAPFTLYDGYIDKIDTENKILTVRQLPSETPGEKIIFEIIVNDKTNIIVPGLNIFYWFKKDLARQDSQNQTVTFNELKVGQLISVYADQDIRTLKTNKFTAINIIIQSRITTFYGNIDRIENNVIFMKGFTNVVGDVTRTSSKEGHDYEVTVNSDTEISALSKYDNTTPIAYSISDLKPDMFIVVSTGVDVLSDFKVVAKKIDPQI